MTDNDQTSPVDQEFDREKLRAFVEGLNANEPKLEDGMLPEDAVYAKELLEKVKPILTEAMQMEAEGADADTPLAALLGRDEIISMVLSIAMSPMHTEFQKARLICAITLICTREYNIAL